MCSNFIKKIKLDYIKDMKKKITICIALMAILLGGFTLEAKTIKSSSRTSHSSKKPTRTTLAEVKNDEEVIKFFSNGKFEVEHNGNVFDQGPFIQDNGALVYVSDRSGISWIIYGNTWYDLNGLNSEGAEGAIDWSLLPNIILRNGYQLEKVLANVKFDPASETVSYNFDGESGKFKLSQIPQDYRTQISWLKNL